MSEYGRLLERDVFVCDRDLKPDNILLDADGKYIYN